MSGGLRVAVVLLILTPPAVAQSALLQQADRAAREDRHFEAIAKYELYLSQAPAERDLVLPRLGRQYLWAEQPERAAALLGEYLQRHEDCGVRLHHALALSWAERMRPARDAYRRLGRSCPEFADQARQGEARVLRWMDRPLDAARLYGQGDGAEAKIGLALVELALDNNRAARAQFSALLESGHANASVLEGVASAELRLGDPQAASTRLTQAAEAGLRNRWLHELSEHIRLLPRPAVFAESTFFRDGDGTTRHTYELAASHGLGLRSRASLSAGAASLSAPRRQAIHATWGGAGWERRTGDSLAFNGNLRYSDFGRAGFRPVTGELNAVFTPADRLRVDLSAARVLIADNMNALEHRLAGFFMGAGVDLRATPLITLSAALDTTAWNDGNRRTRYRATLQHRFQGVPRVTLSWPTLFQTYDRGFSFALFSPRRYVETGGAVNVYARRARHWNLSGYARIGTLRESGGHWQPMMIVRGEVERELARAWGFRAAGGWNSSNLSDANGFRRTWFSLSLSRRF